MQPFDKKAIHGIFYRTKVTVGYWLKIAVGWHSGILGLMPEPSAKGSTRKYTDDFTE